MAAGIADGGLAAALAAPACGAALWALLGGPAPRGGAPGDLARGCCGAAAARLGTCGRRSRWWWLGRAGPGFVATLERPGAACGRKAAQELEQLGCVVAEVVPGRVYFRAAGAPEPLRGARSVEQIGAVVLRHGEDPVQAFLAFDGASTEACLARIVAAVLAADWSAPLALWATAAGRPTPPRGATGGLAPSFRVRAKRSTKAGQDQVSSDAIAGAVGGALADRFGWRVDLSAPELDVRLQLNQEELLVSLSALVQPLGSRGGYLEKAGLHPSVSWALAKTADIQPGDVVVDPMCGCGVLLCEAAQHWPHAREFLGTDVEPAQLSCAMRNLAGARLQGRVQLLRADASLQGGLPLASGSAHRLLTDMPFGKQFGSVAGNLALYPRLLAEFARVVLPGGRAVLLTDRSNGPVMRMALGRPAAGASGAAGDAALAGAAAGASRSAASLHAAWTVEHRRTFRLFVKTDACIYVLRRTAAPAPAPDAASAAALVVLAAEGAAAGAPGAAAAPAAAGAAAGAGPGGRRARGRAVRLGGDAGRLPWEDGSSWHEQCARERPALLAWGERGRAGR